MPAGGLVQFRLVELELGGGCFSHDCVCVGLFRLVYTGFKLNSPGLKMRGWSCTVLVWTDLLWLNVDSVVLTGLERKCKIMLFF